MTSVGELQIRKKALEADLAADKKLSDKMSEVQHEINGINCKDIIRKCRSRKDIAKKYKKQYNTKKRRVNGIIKEINAKIKHLTRKRCPRGSRKNRKSGKCEKK